MASLIRPSAPERQPPEDRSEREADDQDGREARSGGRDETLDEAGNDEPGRRAEDERDRGPGLSPQRVGARPASRLDERPAEPQARGARDDDARSSSTPCAVTSSKNGRPLPAPIARPETTPRSTPFMSSTAAVPIPARIPPANARNVTRMLFVKISDENAASSPGLSPRS